MAIELRTNPSVSCRCGRPLDRGAVRCECGEKVAPRVLTCNSCGASIVPGDEYYAVVLQAVTLTRCQACGARMVEAKQRAAEDEAKKLAERHAAAGQEAI